MSQEEKEAVRQDFLDSLQDLTLNSRPIITSLTVIAQENVRTADAVVKAIEEHITKCAPAYKLPALYLLDSISKNIGNPYTVYFGLNLYKTFTNAYTQVSETVRKKMHELFQTWKQPTSSGRMLFANEPIQKIESFLARVQQSAGGPSSDPRRAPQFVPSLPQQNGPLTKQALLVEVDKLIDLTHRRKALEGRDSDADQQLVILNQLKTVLSNQSLRPETLPAIQQQLVTFNQKEMEKLQRASVNASSHNGGNPLMMQQPPPPSIPVAPRAHQYGYNNNSGPAPQSSNLSQVGNMLQNIDFNKLAGVLNQQQQHQPQQQPQFPNSAPPLQTAQPQPKSGQNTQDLINKIMGSGILGKLASPQPDAQFTQLYMEVELSNASLNKSRPHLIDTLYKSMPNQCSTCGKRFLDNKQGSKERSAHLDWHFRVNKKLRDENVSQNRCWYQQQENWIEFKDEDEVLGLTNEREKEIERAKGAEEKKNKSREELLKSYVRVPADKAKAKLPCPVCREKFQSEWNDDVEAWVWTNAVQDKGRIYHATCHAEADEGVVKRPSSSAATPTPPPPPASAPPKVDLSNVNWGAILAATNKRKREEDAGIKQEPIEEKKIKTE
ncbi:hypothetical protein TRVA0_016S00342 [Trichomonascus vanleenenianus]|uniref:Pcf11p n=1 Tax=Trichomonascus vanleenenianus TaxID=2268995 RepID=UPI003EC97741